MNDHVSLSINWSDGKNLTFALTPEEVEKVERQLTDGDEWITFTTESKRRISSSSRVGVSRTRTDRNSYRYRAGEVLGISISSCEWSDG